MSDFHFMHVVIERVCEMYGRIVFLVFLLQTSEVNLALKEW